MTEAQELMWAGAAFYLLVLLIVIFLVHAVIESAVYRGTLQALKAAGLAKQVKKDSKKEWGERE